MKIQKIQNYYTNYKNGLIRQKQTEAVLPSYKQVNELSNLYYSPVTFTSGERVNSTSKKKLAEKSSRFVVTKFSDIPCPACGKKMLSGKKFEKIAEEFSMLPEDEYLDNLGKYVEYMRPVEASVYNEIKELSEKDGDTKDIRTLLVQLRDEKLPILQKAQLSQVKKMRSLARTLPEKEKELLLTKLAKLQSIIKKNNNSESPFRRKIMIDKISQIPIANTKKYEKLQQIAKNFPTSSDMNSAWIVKYSGKNKYNEDWSSYDIALRLLSSSVANTDHILAYSLEHNHDDISNYMAMHNACNGQKGNKTFLEWLNEDRDNRIKYMEDYFETVGELIDSRRIGKKKYRKYVAYATQTIFETSMGKVKLFENLDPDVLEGLEKESC